MPPIIVENFVEAGSGTYPLYLGFVAHERVDRERILRQRGYEFHTGVGELGIIGVNPIIYRWKEEHCRA